MRAKHESGVWKEGKPLLERFLITSEKGTRFKNLSNKRTTTRRQHKGDLKVFLNS